MGNISELATTLQHRRALQFGFKSLELELISFVNTFRPICDRNPVILYREEGVVHVRERDPSRASRLSRLILLANTEVRTLDLVSPPLVGIS